ncbi:pre-rRNA processing [Microbotryomycetes sp. JL221]|nr:pre-rRNA processing [Microbotryomycetes sp. JL221]
MELGAEYTFTSPLQFWSELEDVVSVSPLASLDELDFALRSYVDVASHYMDEFLSDPQELDHALFMLLDSTLFTSHGDRMISNTIKLISSDTTSDKLFIVLMLILHLGLSNPLSMHSFRQSSTSATTGGRSKVFRLMRKRWTLVVPVLMKWVWDAAVVKDAHMVAYANTAEQERQVYEHNVMPAEGWEERVGTAATAVLFEVCRVQKLTSNELAIFSFEFIAHLFMLVEQTRDAVDETFNYTLIKLIIALNEQFMVSALPPPNQQHDDRQDESAQHLPPPILPTIVGKRDKQQRGYNLVLEVLKEKEGQSKTFCENIIFILNRGNNSPDSLCVSLLILKILYLLFTTAGTQEYFYTNDLCVLVDVFIRELNDLGDESEGLRHTYLRVLHPLLTNTQLRSYSYKRPQLRRVLRSLITDSHYRRCDPTTRRLVERNLRGSWCEGLASDDTDSLSVSAGGLGERRKHSTTSLISPVDKSPTIPADQLRNRLQEGTASSLSIDAVAQAEDRVDENVIGSIAVGTKQGDHRRKHRHHHHHHHSKSSSDIGKSPTIATTNSSSSLSTSLGTSSPLSTSIVLAPVVEGTVIAPTPINTSHLMSTPMLSESPPTTPSSLSSSIELLQPTLNNNFLNQTNTTTITTGSKRRRPPPPPSASSCSCSETQSGPPSRVQTPSFSNLSLQTSKNSTFNNQQNNNNNNNNNSNHVRRPAPEPPTLMKSIVIEPFENHSTNLKEVETNLQGLNVT